MDGRTDERGKMTPDLRFFQDLPKNSSYTIGCSMLPAAVASVSVKLCWCWCGILNIFNCLLTNILRICPLEILEL